MIAVRQATFVFAASAIAGVTACAGGNQTSGLPRPLSPVAFPAPTNSGTGKAATTGVRLSLVIPPATKSASRRRPAYVSTATNSLTIGQQGSPAQTVPLSADSPGCSASSGTRTCTVTISAIPGSNQSFTLATFASTDGSGKPLSAQTIVQTITAGTDNTISATLNGVVSALSVQLANTTLPYGQPGSTDVVVNAQDASGNTIVGPGVYADANGNPITVALADGDSSGATMLGESAVTGPTTVPLTYSGAVLAGATISATTSSLSASATLALACGPPQSSSDLYYADGNLGSSASSDGGGFAELPISDFGPSSNSANIVDVSGIGSVAIDNRGYPYGFGYDDTYGQSFVSEFCPTESGTAPPYRSYLIADPSPSPPYDYSFVAASAVDTDDRVLALIVDYTGETYDSDFIEKFGADTGTAGAPTSVVPSPIATIFGPNTELDQALELAAGNSGTVYAGNLGQITEYASTASGNAAPSNAYADTAAGLLDAIDATSDAAGNVYVLYAENNLSEIDPSITFGPPAVVEYAHGSYATPLRVISGSNTQIGTYMGDTSGFAQALHLAVDPSGTIYVLNEALTASQTVEFDIESFATSATGNVAPASTFSVSGVRDQAFAVSANGQIAIGEAYGYGVLLYDTKGDYEGEIAVDSQVGLTYGMAYDASNDLYVSSQQYVSTNGNTYGLTGILTFDGPVTDGSTPATVDPTTESYESLAVDSSGMVHGKRNYGAKIDAYAAGDTTGTPVNTFKIQSFPSDSGSNGLGLDAAGNVYTANNESGVVEAPATSSGRVSPTANYEVLRPSTIYPDVAVDANANVYASSCVTDSVAIFTASQGVGPPASSIIGSNTLLDCPTAIAVDAGGDIFVLTYSQILMFAAGANGNVAPTAAYTFDPYSSISSLAVGPGFANADASFKARAARQAAHFALSADRGPARNVSQPATTCAAPVRTFVPVDRHATHAIPVKPGFVLYGACFQTHARVHPDPRRRIPHRRG